MRAWLGLTLAVFVVLGGAGCARLNLLKRRPPDQTLSAGLSVGMPAPEIEGEDFDGQRFRLSDYRGKIVVVSFWTST